MERGSGTQTTVRQVNTISAGSLLEIMALPQRDKIYLKKQKSMNANMAKGEHPWI